MNSEISQPPILPSLRLYAPFQVRTASFFGGPLGAIYALHQNFKILGKSREQRLTLYWGLGFIITLLAVISVLPKKFPNIVIPLTYTIIAGQIATSKQLTKEAIIASQTYVRHSGWNVVAVSFVSFVAICAVMIPVWLALTYFGIIESS